MQSIIKVLLDTDCICDKFWQNRKEIGYDNLYRYNQFRNFVVDSFKHVDFDYFRFNCKRKDKKKTYQENIKTNN